MVTELIKPGYKKTDVGSIPDDWDLISFDDAFDFLSTASYSRSQLSEDQDILYVHYGDIHTKWKYFLDFLKESLPSIDNAKLKSYSLIKEGDLIMADASEDYEGICRSVEVRNVGSKKSISGLHTFLLRSKKDIFVNGFKGYISSNKLVKTQFDRLATGLKVYGLSKTNLKVVLIPYPKEEEQKTIFHVLSDTDNLIGSLNKLIRKKKNIKKGVMQELLTGKKRLPGFSGKWEVKKLGEVCRVTTGKKDVNEGNPSGGFPFFTCSRSHTYSDSYSFDEEAILVAGNGEVGILHYYRGKFEAYQRTYVLVDFTTDVKYLWYQLDGYLLDSLGIGKIGSSIPYIKMENLVDFKFKRPTIKGEQTAIATILSDMDAEIESLEQKRDKYTMLKKGIMQQLLTGRIRIYANN